jgi:putative FmdB family regulatory protein
VNPLLRRKKMPIYEFRCQKCNDLFEVLVTSGTATEEIACKRCGSREVKKTISASAYRLSSSGGAIPSGSLSGCSSRSGFS